MWLLFFWKRQYKLYDHTVFITYSIAFMSLLFIVITVAATAGLHDRLAGASRVWRSRSSISPGSSSRPIGCAGARRFVRAIVLAQFITIVLTLFLRHPGG